MESKFAILGATGNTGKSLVQILLQNPKNEVRAYCRNKAKLIRLLPEETQNKRLKIFEGSITDVDMMVDCIRDCRAIFFVASMNGNMPGCRVGQDSAITVIEALKKIKAASTTPIPMPKLVVLSSATIDPHLSRTMPWWFHPIMIRAGSYVYDDLVVMERFLRQQQDWVSTIFIKPGGLAVDKPKGYRLDFDEHDSFIAYPDLAAAMLEAADDPTGRYDMKNVSVCNTNGSAAFPKNTPATILYGLLSHYFPWMYKHLPSAGP
jgi:putative NADH-flavin reductase